MLTISGLHVYVGLNHSDPLLDERAEFVAGQVHAVEVGHAVVALHIFAAQLHFAEHLVLVFVEVCQRDFKHAALETFGRDFGALGPGDEGLAGVALSEDGRRLNGVPFLLVERVLGLFLAALLRLCQALVLA